MTLHYSETLRNNRLDEITAAIGSSGLLRVYDGTQPAGPDTAVSGQTLLAELALSTTAAGAASSGQLTFSSISDDTSADASGTPTWFRITTSGGTGVVDGSAAVGSGDLNFNAAIVATGNVSVTSLVITDGTS
jgi:hypothetical protein